MTKGAASQLDDQHSSKAGRKGTKRLQNRVTEAGRSLLGCYPPRMYSPTLVKQSCVTSDIQLAGGQEQGVHESILGNCDSTFACLWTNYRPVGERAAANTSLLLERARLAFGSVDEAIAFNFAYRARFVLLPFPCYSYFAPFHLLCLSLAFSGRSDSLSRTGRAFIPARRFSITLCALSLLS